MLPWAEFWYNTTYHPSTGMTPFQALNGCLPPQISCYQIGTSLVHEVDQQLASRDEILEQLKINLHTARNHMQQIANSKRRDVQYKEGNLTFLKLQPYRQGTVFPQAHQKLSNCFYGLFQIEQKISPVAYKLNLPEGSGIHPMFHVSVLKRKIENNITAAPELPPIADGEFVMELESILDSRWIKKGSRFIKESLVMELRDKFVNLNLETRLYWKREVLIGHTGPNVYPRRIQNS